MSCSRQPKSETKQESDETDDGECGVLVTLKQLPGPSVDTLEDGVNDWMVVVWATATLSGTL